METTGIVSTRHAGTMLNPASAGFGEQGDIKIADFPVLQGQLVEDAIMGFDKDLTVFSPGSGIVSDSGHFFREGIKLPVRSRFTRQLLFHRLANPPPHLIEPVSQRRIADLLLQAL